MTPRPPRQAHRMDGRYSLPRTMERGNSHPGQGARTMAEALEQWGVPAPAPPAPLPRL